MKCDIRDSEHYQAAQRYLADAMAVGTGEVFDLTDLAVAPDGKRLAATGSTMEVLEGLPQQRICLVDLESGAITSLTEGRHRDRMPRWSPCGKRIAYLSDARKPYDFQLRILTLADSSMVDIGIPGRWAETIQWSHDGSRILLLAAGLGADLAGAQGAISTPVDASDAPDWAPDVDLGVADTQWRSLWVYDLPSGDCRQVSPPGVNVWEGCWCGPSHLACIASDGPLEDDWYEADVRLIDIGSGRDTTLYRPADQLGAISASPSGNRIAFVEAICSDRLLVAGTMRVGGRDGFEPAHTASVDVTFTAWQGDDTILFAGMRGFETVLGQFSVDDARSDEVWASAERTFGNALLPEAAPMLAPGAAIFLAESYLSPPALVVVARGTKEREISFGRSIPLESISPGAVCERIEWPAPDGLQIQGWLVRPKVDGPCPLIMQIHGGPVWRSRPRYVGRGLQGLLLRDGYALFQPNPRGSSGQGQDYARVVFGDVGGADAIDLLTGLDHLVERGIADPVRLGVTGGSYGGYMTAWLVTQDPRFAAAASLAPVTDWVSAKFTSHVATSLHMMMGSDEPGPNTLFHARSPILHAKRVTTPTLIVCGELDRSTPPTQGEEFHHALTEAGACSVLLTYPGEGHGVRCFPAMIDFYARMIGWFGRHMPAGPKGE
ncbi:dipeptidyl aminopeptidase/acylaminoacyl peptidase [Paraburkholderia caballeronis]|uniref:alpha/beta hydrolase family protein n=1 Tax=Paraburkholderia caballeronis TaxID=416943 RepID=UPI001065427F|nr:S9 family peptidase [Paraburkholderia caballeronis]TDV33843.1 dipeptidyl aminopeptidase/acylaminoacyl peptidase [Paraburkholderia caballeronis]